MCPSTVGPDVLTAVGRAFVGHLSVGRAPVGLSSGPGVCGAWACLCVPVGRAGLASVGRTHIWARTARQDSGSRAEDPANMCYSCCIFAISAAISSPGPRNSWNSSELFQLFLTFLFLGIVGIANVGISRAIPMTSARPPPFAWVWIRNIAAQSLPFWSSCLDRKDCPASTDQ